MKKLLISFVALCMAGVFSAKAQSASDSAFVRNLNFTTVNLSSMPQVFHDTLGVGSKILKDINTGMRAIGYSMTLTSTKNLEIQTLSSGGNHTLIVLDSNLDNIYWDSYSSAFNTKHHLTAGQYFILVTDCSVSSSNIPYTLSVDEIQLTPLNSLTYTPLRTFSDTIVLDTFRTNDPRVIFSLWGDYHFLQAKGHSFHGTQNKILTVADPGGYDFFVLMDSNYNVISRSSQTSKKLPYTGTYYLAILDYYQVGLSSISIKFSDMGTYYVDNINGNDTNSGLSPTTAFFSLDTALVRTNGIGKFYLTEDYEFTNTYTLYVNCAEILPYQRDIHLKLPTACNSADVVFIQGSLIFGEQGSNNYFIIDSSRNADFDDFLDADDYGTYLEVNNLKVKNSVIPYGFFWGDELILRNCEFTNDSVLYENFIGLEADVKYSLKLENCTISNNYFGAGLIWWDDCIDSTLKITMENTVISNNIFNEEYPVFFYDRVQVNLKSGSWNNNNLSGNPTNMDVPANLSTQNCAGIWFNNATVNIGAGFSMDTNNYLCIDSASIANVTENITVPIVANLYPFIFDDANDEVFADYYIGRRLLSGSATLLADNFRKFRVVQTDTVAWYLHSDGKIYNDVEPEPPVAINTADEGSIHLFPNPASNVLNIALEGSEVNEVVIIDIYGKTVVRNNVADGTNSFDISSLPAGMYFVQLRADNAVKATQKLIKR